MDKKWRKDGKNRQEEERSGGRENRIERGEEDVNYMATRRWKEKKEIQ